MKEDDFLLPSENIFAYNIPLRFAWRPREMNCAKMRGIKTFTPYANSEFLQTLESFKEDDLILIQTDGINAPILFLGRWKGIYFPTDDNNARLDFWQKGMGSLERKLNHNIATVSTWADHTIMVASWPGLNQNPLYKKIRFCQKINKMIKDKQYNFRVLMSFISDIKEL